MGMCGDDEDGEDYHNGQGEGVVEIGERCCGRDAGQRGGKESLGAVGDEALNYARGGVENGGCFAGCYSVTH